MRVVSLVPSVTETLVSWGMPPIACTRYCGQPGIARVGGTKNPDVEAIVELRPDVVIMDSEENRLVDHDRLEAAGISVHATAVRSLGDVRPTLEALAARVHAAEQVSPGTAQAHVPGTQAPATENPEAMIKAFIPIWRRPWMALGAPTYGTSLLHALGVANVFADAGPYPEVSLETAGARKPRVVLATSEPYPFSRRQLPELAQVAPVVFVDGKDLFWWGARTPAALGRLRSLFADVVGQRRS